MTISVHILGGIKTRPIRTVLLRKSNETYSYTDKTTGNTLLQCDFIYTPNFEDENSIALCCYLFDDWKRALDVSPFHFIDWYFSTIKQLLTKLPKERIFVVIPFPTGNRNSWCDQLHAYSLLKTFLHKHQISFFDSQYFPHRKYSDLYHSHLLNDKIVKSLARRIDWKISGLVHKALRRTNSRKTYPTLNHHLPQL